MDSETLRAAARRRLSVDTRALAGFRVVVAVCLLVDLSMRARDVTAFYTDAGVLPRDVLSELFPSLSRLSIHTVSGGVAAQVVLLSVSAAVACALLVGFRSRTAAFVAFVLHLSLYARNPFVLNGGDSMLLVLLLLAPFLPLGARWSFDAVGNGDETAPDTVLRAPGVAALLFLVVIYGSNAVLRYRGEAWMSGTAVRRVFELETVTVLVGPYLAELPAVLGAVNWLWVGMLTISPLLVFLVGWLRAALAGAFIVAHVAMAATLRLGVFPLVVIAVLVLFLPPVFWDRVESVVPSGVGSAVPSRAVASSRAGPVPFGIRSERVGAFVAIVLIATVVLWQGAALGYVEVGVAGGPDPDEYAWKMYSPTPQKTYGWYVPSVELSSGERIDGFRDTSVDENGSVFRDTPPDAVEAYPSTLWYRYLTDLDDGSEKRQRAFADWVCRRTDGRDSDPKTVELWYIERKVVLDGTDERERKRLLTHSCS